MKRRLFKALMFSGFLLLSVFAAGCTKEHTIQDSEQDIVTDEEKNKDTSLEMASAPKTVENTVEEEQENKSDKVQDIDFDELGVTPYSDYKDITEFELSDDLKGAIETMYSTVQNWEPEDISEEGWEESFIDRFLLNSWYNPYYISSKNKVSKEEAEYVQYSLTGQKLFFDDMNENDVIDRSKSSSPFNRVYIDSYSVYGYTDPFTATNPDEGYLIYADIVTQYSFLDENGELDMKDDVNHVSIILIKNPYSCFDGLSIKSITIMPKQVKDYQEGLFELVSMIVWLKEENEQPEIADCLIAEYLGEDIEAQSVTAENGLTVYTSKRVEKSKIENFYKEVLGEERSFDTDHFTGEVGVVCGKDGYCYSIASALPEEYTVINNIVSTSDSFEVTAWKMDAIQGRELGEISFTMETSDNEFGYTLKN